MSNKERIKLDELIAKYEEQKWIDCDHLGPFDENQFDSIMYYLKENKQLKEKAEKYDDLMNANHEIVQNNISLTQIHQENKRLKSTISYRIINCLRRITRVRKP